MSQSDSPLEATLDQFPLFPFDASTSSGDEDESGGRYRSRPRKYDEAILRYVAYYRIATTHQVAYRFFVYAGKGPRYGFQVVRKLVTDGYLESQPLDPEKGRASRQVLRVTKDGWRKIGHTPPRKSQRTVAQSLVEYRLQFADTMLERESVGWRLVPEHRSFRTLKEWGLRPYRGRLLNASEQVLRERLERMPDISLPVRLLGHKASGEVRLILPVRRGKSFAKVIDSLPSLSLFPPIEFELICSHLDLLDRAKDYLRRWGRDSKVKYTVHRNAHFRSRPHPRNAEQPDTSRYEQHDVGDPRQLL